MIFVPYISAFLYNQSEIAFGQNALQFLKDSQEIEDLIGRRKRISASMPKDFMDLRNLSEEVMKKFNNQESILAVTMDLLLRQEEYYY